MGRAGLTRAGRAVRAPDIPDAARPEICALRWAQRVLWLRCVSELSGEFESLERCAAYVAAQHALAAVHHVGTVWPAPLATQAQRAALAAVMTTAESIAHAHGSAGRRRCLRSALASAIALAATVDVARALGVMDPRLEHAQRVAGRAIAMLGMFFHASAAVRAD